jgi:glyoxylase-like metal-dependent hydrolase (beta-lactamase superfamily II)
LKKIFEDIYSFILPIPFKLSPELTLYFIDGEKPALIDTGLGDPGSLDIIYSELNSINKNIKDISLIINTHEHIEHFGGDKKLREVSGAPVAASSEAAIKIENSQKINLKLKEHLSRYDPELAREFRAEIDFDLKIDESRVDIILKEDDIIDTGRVKLRVISTPGHAPGHICLYDEDRKLLFTGDHIIAGGSTFVGYDYREIVSQKIVNIFNNEYDKLDNLTLYIESLKKLQLLDLDQILPSHGDPIKYPYKKLEQEIGKKERRSRMFLNTLEKKNEISLKELTARVYGRKNNGLIHRGSALGYLARFNRSGIIETVMRSDDLYLRIKNS